MILSGHQPVYLPGIIVFNKIALSDAFMFVGHCQYSPKSWHTRNRIRHGDREILLSVPVVKAGRFGQSINETEIDNQPWQKKHLATIYHTYHRRPFFRDYFPELEELLTRPSTSLGEMNMAIIRAMMRWFEIDTQVLDSVDYGIQGHKTDMLIAMCLAARADRYLSNLGSQIYVNEEDMRRNGIEHCWQEFVHPVYEQGGTFLPNMSAIDLAFNVGPRAAEIVRACGRIASTQVLRLREGTGIGVEP
jgi:WbqC-like protein family